MAGMFGMVVLACVIFVDTPTMGGAESTTMPIVAKGGLYLSDAKFGFSGSN